MTKKELDTAISEIGKNDSSRIETDVYDLTDLDSPLDAIKDHKGHIDILYVNAGVIQFAPFGKISEEKFDKVFDINVNGGYI